MRGYLITFEGIDGSGKSTQANRISEWLIDAGRTSSLLREPGGTVIGENIRSLLLDNAFSDMTAHTELFLYLAARAQITAQVIVPALNRGEDVIMDRYIDSYINDAQLFKAARKRLEESGNALGYSLACDAGKCSCEFNFGEKGFVHMGAVVEDHGVWEDPSQYFASDKYLEFNAFERRCYPLIAVLSNRNIRRLRRSA